MEIASHKHPRYDGSEPDFRQEVDERLGEESLLQQSGSSHQQKTPVMNRGLMSAV